MPDSQRFNQETFSQWRDHPLTELFLTYLKDRQARLANQWAQGNLMASETQARASLLGQLAQIRWDDVESEYEPED